jgi:hypothetical protein
MKMNLFGGISLIGLLSSLGVLIPNHAHAGLIGPGTTVQAFYYNGVFASPEGQDWVDNMGNITSLPAPLTAPVDFLQGAASGSTIHVGNTQIVITNQLAGFPFCFANTPGTACVDVIDGFDFKFTGENILGVSVDASSAAAFLPVTGTFQGNTHLGLQLLSNNEIQVDVTGDLPALNDQLVLDLSFSTASVPAPIAGAGLPGLLFAGGGFLAWRRKRTASAILAAA